MTDEEMEQLLREVGVPEEYWEGSKETMKLGFVPTRCEIAHVPGAPPLVTVVFEPINSEEYGVLPDNE